MHFDIRCGLRGSSWVKKCYGHESGRSSAVAYSNEITTLVCIVDKKQRKWITSFHVSVVVAMTLITLWPVVGHATHARARSKKGFF
jgi:hypothetical protein